MCTDIKKIKPSNLNMVPQKFVDYGKSEKFAATLGILKTSLTSNCIPSLWKIQTFPISCINPPSLF